MKHILVLTSIHGEQPILDKIRNGIELNNWQCVIAGDTISKPIRNSDSLTAIPDEFRSLTTTQHAEEAIKTHPHNLSTKIDLY